MTPNDVQKYADQLRQYATHFAPRDWCYTRDHDLLDIKSRHDPDLHLASRVRSAVRWLRKDKNDSLAGWGPGRWYMARHALRRHPNLPDGVLDRGAVITYWEETGEYLQYVQPSVGEMLADWMDADPESPHAQRIAAEMKRINDDYGARIKSEGV